MLRLRLDGRHQGQHLPAIEAFGHDEIGQLRLALGEGASLVESDHLRVAQRLQRRSEEHTSELQSLMRISYAVFCLKKKIRYQAKELIRYKTITEIINSIRI